MKRRRRLPSARPYRAAARAIAEGIDATTAIFDDAADLRRVVEDRLAGDEPGISISMDSGRTCLCERMEACHCWHHRASVLSPHSETA